MIINIPYFMGRNTLKIGEQVSSIYTDEFLEPIFKTLSIEDDKTQKGFQKFVIQTGISYLNAIDMNANRIQPNQQKKLYKNYEKSLKHTQNMYREIKTYSSSSANYHDALKELVEKTKEPGMREMFHPYIGLPKDKDHLAGIAVDLFDKFLGILADAAKDAPNHIKEYDKANISKKCILWWLYRMSKFWDRYTNTPFVLGDWYTNETLGISESESNDKKGRYFSVALDVLFELLNAIDKKISRADIETAMRKYKKI